MRKNIATNANNASTLQQSHPLHRSNAARRNIVVGTSSATGSNLVGVPRVLDIFVGGCGNDTTEADVTEYCSSKGITLKKCEVLPTKSEWYGPYKISVSAPDRDNILKPEFWPQSVFVRKFFKARIGRNSTDN